jgi:hypothetical protein
MDVIKKSILLYCIAILSLWGHVYCNTVKPNPLVIGYVDPLQKVLKGDDNFSNGVASMDAARGEVASLQFVIRSKDAIKGLTATVKGLKLSSQVRFVGYVKVNSFAKEAAKDKINAPDSLYPDPLLEDAQIDVAANNSQPVWISVTVPLNAAPGIYKGKLVIEGNGNVHEERDFELQVFAVQLKKPEQQISIWPSTENPNLSLDKKLALLSTSKDFKPFTDPYWAMLKKMAEMMHQYYQNVIMVYSVHTMVYTLDDKGKYTFDFTNFDKTISIFRDAGVNGRIEGSFLGGRESGWYGPFTFYYYAYVPGRGVVSRTGDLKNAALVNFYQQYIPALVAHLKEKKWYDDYYQHLADEPIDQNSASYTAFYNFIKQLAPDLKTMEAVNSTKLPDIDVVVPQLEYLKNNYEYYKRRISSGKEVWSYTCWLPQGEYANRFIELPLIKTRLLHWINFKYGMQGYLHWAYNNWSDNPLDHAGTKGESLPGGDKWVVYPKKGGFLSSIRLEAMRDGIVDNELLKMLAAKNPKLSADIAASIVYNFDSYQTNIVQFRKARTKILQALSN